MSHVFLRKTDFINRVEDALAWCQKLFRQLAVLKLLEKRNDKIMQTN